MRFVCLCALAAVGFAASAGSAAEYGAPIGEYRGVTARSNAGNRAGEYQCVGLARAYFKRVNSAYVLPFLGASGTADQYFPMVERGEIAWLKAFSNGSTDPPKEGDLLCYEGVYHVGIMSSPIAWQGKMGSCRVFEQNVSDDTAFGMQSVRRKQGGYWLEPRGGMRPQGWCRVVTGEQTDDDGIALICVIDRSGSMNEGDKLERVRHALVTLANIMRPTDKLAVVEFAVQSNVSLAVSSVTAARHQIGAVLGRLTAQGGTDIGEGLQGGYALAKAANTKSYTVLLSDGENTHGSIQSGLTSFVSAQLPVTTVGYGADADRRTLMEIADRTGGLFFSADTTTIEHIYARLVAESRQESTVLAVHDWMRGGSLGYAIAVDEAASSLSVFADAEKSANFRLLSPSKQRQSPHFTDTGRAYFLVDAPEVGSWQLSVDGQPSQQVNVAASLGGKRGYAALSGFEPSYRVNGPVPLRVRLEVKNPPEILEATIRRPVLEPSRREGLVGGLIKRALDDRTVTVHLRDDGQSRDGVAGDGVYGATFNSTQRSGVYVVEIPVKLGKVNGTVVRRILRHTFQVGDRRQNESSAGDLLKLLFQ